MPDITQDLLRSCQNSLQLIEQFQEAFGLKCIEASGLSPLAYSILVEEIRTTITKATEHKH